MSKVIDLWPLCYFNYIQGRHSTKCNVLLCSYTQLQIKKTPEYIILYTILRQKNLHGLRFPTCERRRSSGAKGGFPFSIISGVKSGYTISKLKRSHGILPYTQFSDNKKTSIEKQAYIISRLKNFNSTLSYTQFSDNKKTSIEKQSYTISRLKKLP